MNQLELILVKPIEEMLPDIIAFNNTELMTAAKNMLTMYQGIEYSESSLAQAKEDRATLNKFCTALDDERKRVKKIYEMPLARFTNEVNEVICAIKGVSDEIDTQVKSFDEKRKNEKLSQLKEYYQSVIGGLSESVPYDKIHDIRWLNSTITLKKAQEEIAAILKGIDSDLFAIDALNSENKPTLIALYFRNLSLSAALAENQRLENEKARAAQIIKERQAIPTLAPESMPISQPQPIAPQIQLQPEMKKIQFEVEGTVEQFMALREFLLSNKIIYRAIKN